MNKSKELLPLGSIVYLEVGKAVKSMGEAVSTTFGGIGKALGFG